MDLGGVPRLGQRDDGRAASCRRSAIASSRRGRATTRRTNWPIERLQKKDLPADLDEIRDRLPAEREIELWWQCMVRLRYARRNADPRQTLLQRIRLVRGQCLPQPQWEPLGCVPYKTTRFSDLLPPPGSTHPAARILSTGTIRLRTRSDPRRHRFLLASQSAVRLRRRSAERAHFWTAPPRRSVPPCWRLRPRSCWCACRARPNGP